MSRFDQVLGALFDTADPTSDEFAHIEAVYRAGVAASVNRARRRRNLTATAAAVAAVAAVTVGVLATRPGPAQATLTEIAEVVLVTDLDTVTGDFYLTESSATLNMTANFPDGVIFTYTLDEERRTWVSRTGRTAIETTFSNPTFASSEDRALYEERGLAESDRLGETELVVVDDAGHAALDPTLSTDPDELLAQIRSRRNVTTQTDVVEELLELITASPATPELRAATIRALARLDLTLVDRTADRATFRTTPTDGDTKIIGFGLGSTGQLVSMAITTVDPTTGESGAVVYSATYTPTRLTEFAP